MQKNERRIISCDQILTTESDVRFLIFENTTINGKARFSELFYDSGKIISRNRELEFEETERINCNLSRGISDGRIYYAHDFKIDRDCYFGYIMDNPENRFEIMCRTVIYDRSNLKLQTRILKNIESVENIAEDTYVITADRRIYVVKYMRIKNVVLAIADCGVIPTVGKKCSISKLELTGNRPFEVYKLTSKLIKVEEKEDVYICDTERTRYIILKERENDVFGICCYEPRVEQKMVCHVMEFMGFKPYLSQLVTGIVIGVTRLGHVYVVKTKNATYYMEARFRLA